MRRRAALIAIALLLAVSPLAVLGVSSAPGDHASELHIYDESDPGNFILQAEADFIADDGTVYERSTADGRINMSGMDLDQQYTIRVSAGSSYHTRAIRAENITQQQEIWLLPTTEPSADVVFNLEDRTGNYLPAEETTLHVEKPLTINGNTAYREVTSSQFSAAGEIPTTLRENDSYRLRLQAPNGDTRVLGAYTVTGDDAPTLRVGTVVFEGTNATNPVFDARVTEVNGVRVLRMQYFDPARATTSLKLKAVNASDPTDVIRPESTESGPFGRYVETIPLSSNSGRLVINVTYNATRDGFEDKDGVVVAGDVDEIGSGIIDSRIASALGFLTILATLGLTAIASPRYAGIPTVVVAMALVTFGVVAIHPLLLAGGGVTAILFAVGGGR